MKFFTIAAAALALVASCFTTNAQTRVGVYGEAGIVLGGGQPGYNQPYGVPAPPPGYYPGGQGRHPQGQAARPRCPKGSAFIVEVNGCVRHVTDRAEINAVAPPIPRDPFCADKPDGFRYDVAVTGPRGERGVAHKVCWRR